jgi:5-hydroxyisourate hydrolase-like protein (transthyretin family)
MSTSERGRESVRVEVTPQRLSVVPGRPAVVTVRVTNTGTVISGHRIRVLGIDDAWAALDQDQLSLFPDASGTAVLTLTLPKGIPAGARRIDIEVLELTPPADRSVTTVELSVPELTKLGLRLDPVSATGGSSTVVGVLAENTGNAPAELPLAGRDDAGEIDFDFTPPQPTLAPGEQLLVSARLRAPRPWFGTPKVRPYTVELGPAGAPVIAQGAWLQTPRLSRGALALTGLLAALTVFAVVIAVALSSVVSSSNANRDLALQVAAAAANHGSATGAGVISGTVEQLTTGQPAPGVTVDLFQAGNTAQPLVSTSTASNGAYRFQGLAFGSYLLRYDGAGFTELWYPESLTAATAKAVTVNSAAAVTGVNVYLGGLPATISGQVQGEGAAGATLTLELPGAQPPGSGTVQATAAMTGPGGPRGSRGVRLLADDVPTAAPSPTPETAAAVVPVVVSTTTVGANGQFSFTDVPSPAVYQLVLTKPGYATTVQEVVLGGGEDRSGLTLQLSKGNGSLSGTVVSSSGSGIGGATVSASSGTITETTITETTAGHVGGFVLSDLPTPLSLTLSVSHGGFGTQTVAVSLAVDQHLSGVRIVLSPGVGTIAGVVTTPAGSPPGGVTVTATSGKTVLTTVTLSTGRVGFYRFAGLPVPGTYTLTFSRPDLATQTQAVSLPEAGSDTAGAVDVTMASATTVVRGVVTACATNGATCPSADQVGVGDVTVTLTSGSNSYTVTTASVLEPGQGLRVGSYVIDGVSPGTYDATFTRPGGAPTSRIVTLQAGGAPYELSVLLTPTASIVGYVDVAGQGKPATGAQVTLYQADQFPTVPYLPPVVIAPSADGQFSFANLPAPASYIVAVAYPSGSSIQETVQVTVALGVTSPACGSNATGLNEGPSSSPCTLATYQANPIEVAAP